ncbi:CrcB family protein [Gordonia sp. ABSL1-1]|uniref:fluoride efflux transporter FluC n=1 Tax=Gordonia sp. ABSL1-1 TaxID=3053923 RepID=UPI0025735898|nr:CrcB family protein [Gordonia sp. ABSL1-1]MDL9936815.1 CrcB family protein [Gordonia sp. ABSL1-1]
MRPRYRDSHPELPFDPDTDADPATRVPLHRRPTILLWVFAGGLLGTGLRAWIEELWPTGAGQWPWATFLINVAGAFVLGALLEGLGAAGNDEGWWLRARVFAGTGICGAFTTYSTFALEVSLLGRDDAFGLAIGYAVGSVVAGVLAAWLGIALSGRFVRSSGTVS